MSEEMTSVHDSRLFERLMERVQKDASTGCWNWTGPKKKPRPGSLMGYGIIGIWSRELKRSNGVNTHRAMWIALHGPLKSEQLVCHKCDNPLCINPDHLYIGDYFRNARDMRDRNRAANSRKTHCPRGHAYAEHGYLRPQDGYMGWRACRACERGRQRVAAGWPEDLAYSAPPLPHNGLDRFGRPRSKKKSKRNAVSPTAGNT